MTVAAWAAVLRRGETMEVAAAFMIFGLLVIMPLASHRAFLQEELKEKVIMSRLASCKGLIVTS
jgi:hypothetical protein